MAILCAAGLGITETWERGRAMLIGLARVFRFRSGVVALLAAAAPADAGELAGPYIDER